MSEVYWVEFKEAAQAVPCEILTIKEEGLSFKVLDDSTIGELHKTLADLIALPKKGEELFVKSRLRTGDLLIDRLRERGIASYLKFYNSSNFNEDNCSACGNLFGYDPRK